MEKFLIFEKKFSQNWPKNFPKFFATLSFTFAIPSFPKDDKNWHFFCIKTETKIHKEGEMKRFVFIGFLLGIFFLSLAAVQAYTIPFSDTAHHWPSWGNGNDDDADVIGNPNLYGGTVEIDSQGYLKKITFIFETWKSSWLYTFTDLFLDVDADNYWDYVVKLYTCDDQACHNGSCSKCKNENKCHKCKKCKKNDDKNCHGTTSAGEYAVYSIHVAESDNDSYVMSYWNSDNDSYREDHPVALNGTGNYRGKAYFDGVSPGDNETYFKFSGLDISLGDEFIIAWTVHCANDVIYEKIGNPVPEPASLLLVGAGLLGIGAIVRRRKS